MMAITVAVSSAFAETGQIKDSGTPSGNRYNQSPRVTKDSTVIDAVLGTTIPMDSGLMYDRTVPLDLLMEDRGETTFYKKYYIKFTSVNDQRVPGLYLTPKGVGPFPVALFMCGQGGRKEDVLVLVCEGRFCRSLA